VFVRSPYPSARILSINTEAARAHPGVVAVFVGSDIDSDGVDACRNPLRFPMGAGEVNETPRPLLVQDRVRFVGESVAVVIAQTEFDALNAAELVAIDYEQEAAVVDVGTALAPDAPLVWPDRPRNAAYEWSLGDFSQVDEAFLKSARVVTLRSRVSRFTAAAMEPRGALAYPGNDGRLVLRLSHQSPHLLRNEIAAIFALKRDEFRVIAGDVGGSFGMKSGALREELVIFWAARKLGRPVRWTATRAESFLADDQGREVNVTAQLGLDGEGRFTGLRVRYDCNIGAYLGFRSTVGILQIGGVVGVFTIPVVVGEVIGHFSQQPPTSAYRGAGRPEATYTIERLIDVAAAETGIDPAQMRRRNLIPPSAMPYKTPFVSTYDCGEFERNMDRALELSAYREFPRRREESRSRGRLRGIGIANPIEVAGGPYKQPATDWSTLRAHPDGSVILVTGTMSAGQGHETALTLQDAAAGRVHSVDVSAIGASSPAIRA
jgi:aerobic carbon-monoxide dehydrogenase large subunit